MADDAESSAAFGGAGEVLSWKLSHSTHKEVGGVNTDLHVLPQEVFAHLWIPRAASVTDTVGAD